MRYRKKRIKKIISVIISVCVIAAVLCTALYEEAEQRKAAEKWDIIAQKAVPYEKELWQIEDELLEMKKNTAYISERAEIVVGFLASEISDIEYIRQKAELYSLKPVLVIDCTGDMQSIEDLIYRADNSWEIMLYASDFSEKTSEKIAYVKAYMKSMGKADCGIFFIRRADMSSDNRDMLMELGFEGYTSFHDYPQAGQRENGTIYFDYSHIKSSDTSVEARLSMCYSGRASMIYIFDMESLHNGSLSENSVTSNLRILQSYASRKNCTFATVAEVAEELSSIRRVEAENKALYEEKAAPMKARIAELRRIIRDIYSEGHKD